MNVVEILKQALVAVNEAALPEDLRIAGFERAVALLSPAGGAAATASPASTTPMPDASRPPATGRLASVSAELGLATGEIERLFDEHEGELQFVADVGRFGKTTSAKVSALATILAAARQGGKYDEGATPDAAIRREVDRHGLLDVGNYGKHLQPLKSFFNINGAGKSASYKIKYDGRQKAKALAKMLLEP